MMMPALPVGPVRTPDSFSPGENDHAMRIQPNEYGVYNSVFQFAGELEDLVLIAVET